MSLQKHDIFTFPVHCLCECVCMSTSHRDISSPLQHFSTLSDNERNFTQWIHFSLWSQERDILRGGDSEKTGYWVKRGANTRERKRREGMTARARKSDCLLTWWERMHHYTTVNPTKIVCNSTFFPPTAALVIYPSLYPSISTSLFHPVTHQSFSNYLLCLSTNPS